MAFSAGSAVAGLSQLRPVEEVASEVAKWNCEISEGGLDLKRYLLFFD